jgi:hypothetical protein
MTYTQTLTTDRKTPTGADAVGRPITAWFVAAIAAAAGVSLLFAGAAVLGNPQPIGPWLNLLGAVLGGTLFLTLFVLLFTALPWPVLVWALRASRVQRGFGDAFAGAVMGGGLIQIFGMPLIYGEVGLSAVFAAAGAIGGLTYWLVNGRPE